MPQQIFTQTQALNAIIDQMLAEKKLDLTDEERKELKAKLREQLSEKMQNDMLAAMSDGELLELEDLLNREASDAELDEFFRNVKVNFDEVAKKSVTEFREEFLNGKMEVSDVE